MAWSCEVVGYMIGNVKETEITIWVGIKGSYKSTQLPSSVVYVYPETAYVEYGPQGPGTQSPGTRVIKGFDVPFGLVRCGTKSHGNLAYEGFKVVLEGLTANTTYDYMINISGNLPGMEFGITTPFMAANLEFTTAPSVPRDFKVMFSSCQKATGSNSSSSQPAWAWANAGEAETLVPDLNILLGDTHYADSYERNKKWASSMAQFAVSNYQKVISRVPTYAVYDDHDFIDNNTGGDTLEGKKKTAYGPPRERASRYFDGLWIIPPIPSTYRTRDTGCFHSFSYSGVHFFMLDTLYYRCQGPSTPIAGNLLGVKQWDWLIASMKCLDKDDVIVICSSATLQESNWSWKSFPAAVELLSNALTDYTKVLMVTGDVHYMKYNPKGNITIDDTDYPVPPELISSGIGRTDSAATQGFAFAEFNTSSAVTIQLFNVNQPDNRPYDTIDVIF